MTVLRQYPLADARARKATGRPPIRRNLYAAGIVGAVCLVWTAIAVGLASEWIGLPAGLAVGLGMSVPVAVVFGRHLSPMFDDNMASLGRERHVTEHRAAERRLATAQANLLRATRLSAMGAMASGLAHELNQPLAAASNFIAAAAHLLDQGLATPGSQARISLDDAGAQLRRTSDIVRRLVGFVERGEAELQLEDARVVTREACEVAREEGSSGDAELVVELGPEPCMALVDRTQMQQVLLNLIRNAAEAIEPTAHGRISVVCKTGGDAVEITVADNGPGLSPEIAGRLFQPFVSTKPQGMGIGLTICRTIVEGHGGVLSAASASGGGMIFTVWLPQAGWWERSSGEPAPATLEMMHGH